MAKAVRLDSTKAIQLLHKAMCLLQVSPDPRHIRLALRISQYMEKKGEGAFTLRRADRLKKARQTYTLLHGGSGT